MTAADWPEAIWYVLITFLIVLLALAITSAIARGLLRRSLRRRFQPLPFMNEYPWRDDRRSWWWRVKAWLRRFWKK